MSLSTVSRTIHGAHAHAQTEQATERLRTNSKLIKCVYTPFV